MKLLPVLLLVLTGAQPGISADPAPSFPSSCREMKIKRKGMKHDKQLRKLNLRAKCGAYDDFIFLRLDAFID
ncbi:hypothetical protein IMZ48_36795 [Candidatus Bathyarchaeota archaeon]|nr:hypothetical protein [Candidatus Bathyarchaeota archaeon]